MTQPFPAQCFRAGLRADVYRPAHFAATEISEWLSILEACGQVVLLEPWFSNRTKSIVKSPKLYLADSGLLCALLNIRNTESLATSPSVGAVWETFVLAGLAVFWLLASPWTS